MEAVVLAAEAGSAAKAALVAARVGSGAASADLTGEELLLNGDTGRRTGEAALTGEAARTGEAGRTGLGSTVRVGDGARAAVGVGVAAAAVEAGAGAGAGAGADAGADDVVLGVGKASRALTPLPSCKLMRLGRAVLPAKKSLFD